MAAQYVEELIPSTPFGVAILANPESSSSRVTWDYFDETGYVQRGRLRQGEDPYLRNRFNQQASDALSSNRIIPDTRNAKWVSNLIVLVHDIPDAIYWNGVFSILNKLYVKLCGDSSHCNLIKIHTQDYRFSTWNITHLELCTLIRLFRIYFTIYNWIYHLICMYAWIRIIYIHLHLPTYTRWIVMYGLAIFMLAIYYTIYTTQYCYCHWCVRINVHPYIINSQLHTKFSI